MLLEYDHETEHKADTTNTYADAVSHSPYLAQIIEPVPDDLPVPSLTSIDSTSTINQSHQQPFPCSYDGRVATPLSDPSSTTHHKITSQLTCADIGCGIFPECSTSVKPYSTGQKAVASS